MLVFDGRCSIHSWDMECDLCSKSLPVATHTWRIEHRAGESDVCEECYKRFRVKRDIAVDTVESELIGQLRSRQ